MRPDLDKVLTERPRWGSHFRNLKTGARFKHYDEARPDRYSLPKRGKMLMGNRDLAPHHESKDFTDKLGPLKRWLASQVGRNWDSQRLALAAISLIVYAIVDAAAIYLLKEVR